MKTLHNVAVTLVLLAISTNFFVFLSQSKAAINLLTISEKVTLENSNSNSNSNLENATSVNNEREKVALENSNTENVTSVNEEREKVGFENSNSKNATSVIDKREKVALENSNSNSNSKNATSVNDKRENLTSENSNSENATSVNNEREKVALENPNSKNATSVNDKRENVASENSNPETATSVVNDEHVPEIETATQDTPFSCEVASRLLAQNERPPMLNFFASAMGQKYEDLLPLYAFFALAVHRNVGGAVVEMLVPNRKAFLARHIPALNYLQKSFSDDEVGLPLCVREYTADHLKERKAIPNTWRYLEVPSLRANYTYIGDVDIFYVESVLHPMRFQQMEEFGLPYSNVVRNYNDRTPRLTGLMLLETDAFYTDALLRAQATVDARGNDEHFLYKIVVDAGIGVPPSNSTSPLLIYRPAHGIHLSMNRGPGKRLCGPSLKTVDVLLEAKGLDEYLGVDAAGKDFLSKRRSDAKVSTEGHYDSKDGTCQPPRNSTAVRRLR